MPHTVAKHAQGEYSVDLRNFMRCLLLCLLAIPALLKAQGLAGLQTAPPVPVANSPFKLTYAGTYFGSPITLDSQELLVSATTIDWTLYISLGSTNTSPALVTAQHDVASLNAGTYQVRVFIRHRVFGSPYFEPSLRETKAIHVAPLNALRLLVEYRHSPTDHYFQTIDPVEIALLDSGHFSGWQRTGQTYQVYANSFPSNSADTLEPVCRYYGTPNGAPETHFFSAFAFECEAIPILFPNQWLLESADVYRVFLPKETNGSCPSGTLPVYRTFNGKPDVNHRYVSTFDLRDQMVAAGWVSEGYGESGVSMCALAPPP